MPPEPAIRNLPQQAPFAQPIANPMLEEVKELQDRLEALGQGQAALGNEQSTLAEQQHGLGAILDDMEILLGNLSSEVGKRVRGFKLGEFTYSWSGIVLALGPRKQTVTVEGAIVGESIWAFPVTVPDGFLISHAQCLVKNTVQLTVYGPALTVGGAAQTLKVLLIALR